MCEFCENISKLKRVKNDFCDGWFPKENKTQIVEDSDGNFHVWDDGSGDSFASGIIIENILFCPMCGRELIESV